MILDGSTNKDTRTFIEEANYENITYFGHEKKQEFIDNFVDIDGIGIDYFISDALIDNWDLGNQRNYAVILARSLGYTKLVMIDDDILIDDINTIFDSLRLL